MINIPNAAVGIVLLFTGRQLFWLFLACLGFWVGYTYTGRIMGPQSEWILAGSGILIGVLCGFIAVFAQQLAVGIAGFVSGAVVTLQALRMMGYADTQTAWLICLAGGIGGTILLTFIYDWALIFLSAFIGGTLAVESVHPDGLDPALRFWIWIGLIVIGAAVQARMLWAGTGRINRRR